MHLYSVITVPATRTIRNLPTEVELDTTDGMPESCALNFDNLTLMPKSILVEKIARLSIDRMFQVCKALRIATGC